MSTVTSTLALRVDDAGFAAKLKSDADAARNLNINSRDLAKLRATTGTAGLIRQYEKLGASVAQVGKYGDAQRGLQTLGAGFRSARVEVARTTAALAAAQKRKDFFDRSRANGSANFPAFEAAGLVKDADAALKKAARAHTAAKRSVENVARSYSETKATVRALGQELERAGHPVADLARVQTDLRAKMDATSSAIHRQARAHEEARVASVAASAETTRRANAALRATVAGAEASRRAAQDAAALGAAEQRRQNRQAIRRAIQAGEEARRDRADAEVAETSRRQNAGRDLARGMGGAGRRQSADIEGGRLVAEGMGAPARSARARARAEADAADVEREEMRAAQSASRRDAAGVVTSAVAVKAATTGKRIAADAITSVAEFDIASRKQRVFTDIGAGDQAMLRAQALKIGQETQFSNIDVVKAQTASMQGLPASFAPTLKAQVAEGIVDNVRDYATLMETDLKEGAETIRSYLQASGKDISTKEKALAESQRATNQIVKMAKLGGMNGEDAAQFVKYAAAPGTSSGLSTDTMLSLGALARRGGLRGDEAGVFMRATAAKLVSPTTKGIAALNAAGINHSDYVKMPDRLSTDLLENQFRTSTGKSFTPEVRKKVEAVNSDKALVADRAKYTAAITAAVADVLGKQKDGTVRASDARVASKAAGDFHKVSAKSVNAEGLLDAVMSRELTLAQLNAFLTDKHGGKGSITARQWEEFRASREQIGAAGDDPSMARGKAKDVMSGVGGSVENLRGSVENFKLALGEAWAGPIQSVADGMGSAVDSFSKMPTAAQQATSALGGLAAAGAGLWGTFSLAGALLGKVGAGAGAGAGAAAGSGGAGLVAGTAGAGAAAAAIAVPAIGAAILTAPLVMADKSKGLVHGGRDLVDTSNFDLGLPGIDMEMERKAKRSPSLPPGTAGMPQPTPARLPGLDGRKREEPPAARRLPGFLTDEATLPPLPQMPRRGQRPAPEPAPEPAPAIAAPAPVAPARPVSMPGAAPAAPVKPVTMPDVAPKADDGALKQLHATADELRQALQAAGATTVSPQANAAGLSGTLAVAKDLLATLNAIPGAINGANGALSRINAGALQGRSTTSRSFSDGVTPGAGSE